MATSCVTRLRNPRPSSCSTPIEFTVTARWFGRLETYTYLGRFLIKWHIWSISKLCPLVLISAMLIANNLDLLCYFKKFKMLIFIIFSTLWRFLLSLVLVQVFDNSFNLLILEDYWIGFSACSNPALCT